ncbi:MAG: hypothetical protein R3D62_08800 [Xanthobacteraceae bacterium]
MDVGASGQGVFSRFGSAGEEMPGGSAEAGEVVAWAAAGGGAAEAGVAGSVVVAGAAAAGVAEAGVAGGGAAAGDAVGVAAAGGGAAGGDACTDLRGSLARADLGRRTDLCGSSADLSSSSSIAADSAIGGSEPMFSAWIGGVGATGSLPLANTELVTSPA